MSVKFENNAIKVSKAMNVAIIAWLYEASGEMKSQVQRNTPVDSGDLKGKWDYYVEESKLEAVVGNPLENAIWNEFGTGEYALEGKGRKGGYWVYVKGSSSSKKSKKTYTLEQAKLAVAILRKKGLDAYYTKGKRPRRSLFNAFQKNKNKLQKALEAKLKELGT